MHLRVHAGIDAYERDTDFHLCGLPGESASRVGPGGHQLPCDRSELSQWFGAGDRRGVLGGVAWGLLAYAINRIFLYGAILIGYFVAGGVLKGTGKLPRFGQVIIPILTVASVLFGDAIFYTLAIMKHEGAPFSTKLLGAVLSHLWEIESQGGGVLTILFALLGAAYALYAARKPKFKAAFQQFGIPSV